MIVSLLLNHPRINDTIRDEQGRTPLECASSHEIGALIEGESESVGCWTDNQNRGRHCNSDT
jgi:hypothetical protein